MTDLPFIFPRKGEAWRSDRLVLNKEVLSLKVIDCFVPLLNEVGEDFVKRVRVQIEKSGRGRWTADLTNELFRFALECEWAGLTCCHCLWGFIGSVGASGGSREKLLLSSVCTSA